MNAQQPSPLYAWVLALRPRTLSASLIPVVVGTAIAWKDGYFQAQVACATFVSALFLQLGTNLTNDYYDFQRGADTAQRLGPPRVTQRGWLHPQAVLRGGVACFAVALLLGVYLVAVGGMAILLIGLASIAAGLAYTAGTFPLAYRGLGDVLVLVFFGFVAVGGSYFLQAHTVTPLALWAALPVGLQSVALLAVNNTRDAETDAAAHKQTLVVRFGVRFGRCEWVACILLSTLVPVGLWLTDKATLWVLVPLASLPLAIAPGRLMLYARGAALNQALAGTARLQRAFGLLFALGLTQ